jgi:hypothetical protein
MMKKIISLRQALDDPQYFGGQLAGPSWLPWRALLLAIMGESLTPDELTLFESLTGRLLAPLEPVREFAGVVGRRGGKSRALGVLAAYLATCVDHRSILAPGELGVLPVLALTITAVMETAELSRHTEMACRVLHGCQIWPCRAAVVLRN